jgi:ribose transport system substrate-binding protein
MKRAKWKKLVSIMLILVMVGGITACSKSTTTGGTKKQITIGFICATMDNAFYKTLVTTAQTQSKALGWKFVSADSQFKTSTEQANFEDYISKKVDMILVDCVDPSGVVASVNEAVAAGIPVIAIDNGVNPAAKVLTTVLSDNKGLGIVGGQWAGKQFDKSTEVKAVMLSGQKGNTEAQKRRNGFWAGLMQSRIAEKEGVTVSIDDMYTRALQLEQDLVNTGKFHDTRSDFTVEEQAFGDFSNTGGMTASEDMLVAHPDVNLLISENDPMAQGALQAIKNRNLQANIKICAVADGEKSTLLLIKQGDIASCGQNNPIEVSKLTINVAKEVLVDGVKPSMLASKIMTPPVLMTKDNIDKYYDPNSTF